jgi:response regulator RpfG family c-di-GMP phosphodiesterase
MLAALGERFDGAGPQALAGGAIPRGARIIRVACAYDAMASSDAYGDSPEARAAAALAALRGAAGAELDPQAVEALAGALGRRAGDA